MGSTLINISLATASLMIGFMIGGRSGYRRGVIYGSRRGFKRGIDVSRSSR